MAESIRLYAFAADRLTRSEFVRAYPDHVLVLTPFTSTEKSGSITRVHQGGGQVAVVPFEVARITKRPGLNPFSSVITVGRASSNDIEIKSENVSKFHAYLMPEPDGVYVADAGSTNGTTRNGVHVPTKKAERVKLSPGDELSLGGPVVVYHDPASLYDFIRTALGRPDSE